jgi:DNA-binding NarL/FixJ family response regulator
MSEKRLLLVEDHALSAEALKGRLVSNGWQVTIANYDQDAFYRIEMAKKEGYEFDIFAIDLGLQPVPDKPEKGLKLALSLRENYENHPILAYTSQGPRAFDYALILRQLLVARISFIYLRPTDDGIAFEEMVAIAFTGNTIISPTPASYLHLTIPTSPDPLRENFWQALKLLNEGKTYTQVASELKRGPEAIQNWVNEMRDILRPSILGNDTPVEQNNGERIQLEDLKNWYRNNRVKYCRD